MRKPKRPLAAILRADIVGFSRLMQDDEADTVRSLKAYRTLFADCIAQHRGRVVDTAGDALLAEFASAIDAVECAAQVQADLARCNQPRDPQRRMLCRIGINLGDVIEDDTTLPGDGGTIAARLEALAEPGGTCVSEKVFDETHGKVRLAFESLGERRVKNIADPLRVYRLQPAAPLELRVLGEIELWRGTRRLELPPSKKTRALLAYLALTQRPQRRDRLCSIFWDIADDPRAALRWSLSKLRPLVDEPGLPRLVARGNDIGFELAGARVDLFWLRQQLDDAAARSTAALEQLAAAFRGEFLEGLELPDFHEFQFWCVAIREEARQLHVRLLSTLIDRFAAEPRAALPFARTLTQVDPLDEPARATLLRLLVACGRSREAEQQFQAARQLLHELGPRAGDLLAQAWQQLSHAPSTGTSTAPATAAPVNPAEDSASTLRAAAEPMIGRHVEWGSLRAALDDVGTRRHLRAAVIKGEPGIGKTHLMRELIDEVRRRNGTVLDGAAYEAETSRPYGPWIDALRGLPAAVIGDTLAGDLALLLPELGVDATEQRSRDRLFGAIAELIAARAHSAPPVLLVLDDVQWCDDASAELLHYVTRRNRNRPLLVALALREGELPDNQPMVRVLRGLRRDGVLDEIDVAPLSTQETAELVRRVAPRIEVQRLYDESAGNPLFALELARARPDLDESVPLTLRRLVRDRIDRLPVDAADALRWAAVVGQAFQVRRLAEITPLDIDKLVVAFEALERHGLLRVVTTAAAGGSYSFAHEVVRQVVYAELSEPRRRLMHLRIAEALRGLDADGESADLAHHAALAGEIGIAARACLRAGQRYLRLFAATEANAMARRGVYYAQQLTDPERLKLQLELMEVRYAAHRPRRPAEAARAVEALAQQALDHGCVEHARLGFHLVSYLRWEGGDWLAAQRQMMRAEQIGRLGDERERVVALAEAARCLTLLERDLSHAEALLAEAEALSKRLSIEPAAIPDGVGMLRLHQGQIDEAAERFAHARELCRREQDRLGEFRALEHCIMLELQRHQVARAQSLCDELLRLAERLREGSEAPFAHALAALCVYAMRDDGNGEQLETALAALRNADAKQRLMSLLTRAAEIAVDRDDVALARRFAEEAVHLAGVMERASDLVLARAALIRAAARSGDLALCESALRDLNDETLRGVSAEARAAARRVRDELGSSRGSDSSRPPRAKARRP